MSCFAHVIYDRRILIKTKQKSETHKSYEQRRCSKRKVLGSMNAATAVGYNVCRTALKLVMSQKGQP
jgi:hypothetical protein